MRSLGFEPINREPCIMRKGSILVIIYIDDYAIAAPTKAEIAETREQLRRACNLKTISPLAKYLGFEIIRN